MSSVTTAPPARKPQESTMSTVPAVRSEATAPAILTPAQYTAALQQWQTSQAHILTPFTDFGGLAASHGILWSVVVVSLDKQVGEVYDGLPFLKKNQDPEQAEVALAKNALRKIAEGLGISIELVHCSVGLVRHYWLVKAIGKYRGLDGAPVTREASMEWDLRDGSDRLKGWTANQISEARKHGLRACETRAINAVIRECGCGLKQAYQRRELRRPFVALRVVFQPDLSDADTRRLVTEHALRGTAALYPGAPAAAEPVSRGAFDDPPFEPEPRRIAMGQTSQAQQQEPPTPTTPAAPDDGAVLVVKVEVKQLKRRNGDGTFPKWHAIDSNGVEHVTIKRDLGQALEMARDAKTPVEIVSQENAYNELEVSEVIALGAARQGGLY